MVNPLSRQWIHHIAGFVGHGRYEAFGYGSKPDPKYQEVEALVVVAKSPITSVSCNDDLVIDLLDSNVLTSLRGNSHRRGWTRDGISGWKLWQDLCIHGARCTKTGFRLMKHG